MSTPTKGIMYFVFLAALKKLLTPVTVLISASKTGTLNPMEMASDSQRCTISSGEINP
jgi:hypothetical protein